MAANLGIRTTPLRPVRPRGKAPHSAVALKFALLYNAPNLDVFVTGSRQSMPKLRCQVGRLDHSLKATVDEGKDFGREKIVRTLLIDNYDSYTYNIYQELSIVNGVPPVVIHNDEWTMEQVRYFLFEEKAFDNIVISPGPGSPACPRDIGICLEILLECENIPILGVCLGHQALGFVHGAQIVHAPEPVHGRLSEIEHSGCNIFSGIPSGRNSGFKVVRYHSLVIDADSLPKELIPVAWTTSVCAGLSDVKDVSVLEKRKVVMGVMHSVRPHYGVQFHPESIATRHGRRIFENFKKITVDHGLGSPLHQERKVSYSCQSSAGLPVHGIPAMQHHLHMCNNQLLSPESLKVKHVSLQWKKIDCLLSMVGGPENIFCGLFGDKNADNTFWLDSSSTDEGRARFSFMGGKGGSLWKQLTFHLADQSKQSTKSGGYLSIEDGNGHVEKKFLADGLFDFLNKEIQSFRYDKKDYEGLPFDFCGGFIGYIGYDLKVECGASSNSYKSTTPDACFFFADNLVAIDHNNGDVYILSIHEIHHQYIKGSQEIIRKSSWLAETEKRLLRLKATGAQMLNMKRSQVVSFKEKFVVEKSRQQYIKDVEKCLELIRDGESYELCLTTQMRKRFEREDYLMLYLNLRELNPAPFAAWLNFAKENLCICCSSPERFLRLDGNGRLEAKPIKGTIARGRTPQEDEHLRLQLQFSEKDRAENLMIVDLLRNDLGRVCEPGTVRVPRLMEVESYATVHTMVSTIQGQKSPNVSSIDCVRAAFPGGSMTGAPKLRSMKLLDSIENSSRGVYSGSIGFFSYNKTFDLNIVIRTVVVHEGEASVGAGGAIVAMSVPEEEYEEMLLKAKAPTRVVDEYAKSADYCGKTFRPRDSCLKN